MYMESNTRQSYSDGYMTATDTNQEFSIESIQEKLGSFVGAPTENTDANPDLCPSASTLNMSFARNYQTAPNTTANTKKANTKQKVVVASYVAVVLALILAITFSVVAVNGAFAKTAQLTGDVSLASKDLEDYAASLTEEDYATLVSHAAELGYYDVSLANTNTYEGLPTRPAQNFNVQTNWFDSLCDWISGIFGD